MTTVLVVDDNPIDLRQTADMAARTGLAVRTAPSGEAALTILRETPGIAAMVLDLTMPDLDGLALLSTLARERIAVPVIAAVTPAGLDAVGSALRQGAVDFIIKPVSAERLSVALANARRLVRLEAELGFERRRRAGLLTAADLVARAPATERMAGLVRKAARTAHPVLIEGETGTGKHLLAEAIRGGGDRAGKPLIRFDCAAEDPAELFGRLFGRRRGTLLEPGAVQSAQGGTLLLTEIGALPEPAQEALLALIRDGEIRPQGATRAERVNLRLIATSRVRLLNLARAGLMREDLYYRLNVMPIYMPPLRERTEDILPLARRMLDRLGAEFGRRGLSLTPDAESLLSAHPWPGNLAEFETALFRAAVSATDGRIEPHDLPHLLAFAGRAAELAEAPLKAPAAPLHIDDAVLRRRKPEGHRPDRFLKPDGEVTSLAEIERQLIVFALAQHGNRMSRVARALGIGRSTLYRKLREFGLEAEDKSDAA
ncbi:sigma-54-dependent Fis family transcriptional regulator [Arsenicitalea aurantiaca]|uniref:DNA-binding transcriptional regulator NtrC n=1 Tax=Arsenicitalea aurantiaca TaxID=1783274 RepID=A0A433XKR4_9HYPH|nr:sigma-54 dependent transcriptional regulator [Arsenicitalea aurantiaca]RUT34614.1 sigma-54-dependent Fis family transcriptional regulator [Arsenicitalea aurantiaca]